MLMLPESPFRQESLRSKGMTHPQLPWHGPTAAQHAQQNYLYLLWSCGSQLLGRSASSFCKHCHGSAILHSLSLILVHRRTLQDSKA